MVSFDGGGSHTLWQQWDQVSQQSNMHFTAFLTGLYLLDADHRMQYKGPGHRVGRSSLGTFSSAQRVALEATDLNYAYAHGQEIGTHYMGHFCSDNPPGGQSWNTADWNSELDQFYATLDRYRAGQHEKGAPQLLVPDNEVRGGRTPCLEGRFSQLMPVLKAHGFTYDSTFARAGLSWPVKSDGIWQLGLPVFPLAGTHRPVIAMDYNYWFAQERATPAASPARANADGAQVLNTYRAMYAAAYRGNRAPIVLGNHFERWNDGVYTAALQDFVRETCQRPDTRCVTFRDLVAWLNAQSSGTLARLQSLPAQRG